MSGVNRDPIFEGPAARLGVIRNSSATDDAASLYLQQIAQAGLLALDALFVCPEAQKLAEVIAQEVDGLCNTLQNVTHLDGELESDLLGLMGAIDQIREEISNLEASTIIERLPVLEENIEELSARIVWRVVTHGALEMASTTGSAGDSSPSTLTTKAENEKDSPIANLPETIDLPRADLPPQSTDVDKLTALLFQLGELSGTTATDTTPTDRLPISPASEVRTPLGPSIHHHNQILDFEETHQRGIDLLELFKREGDPRKLSNSVSLLRESLVLSSPDQRQHIKAIGDLAGALLTQYQQKRNYSDLLEIIALNDELLKLCPHGHPDRAYGLGKLSIALFTRYEHEGRLSDLSEAIEYGREALQLSPSGHPYRAMRLNNLSNALLKRYQREGSMLDLSEAIGHCREGLKLHPPGSPARSNNLSNLSNMLLTRYEREGILSDLSGAVESCQEALELLPPTHPDRAYSLIGLSNALMTRFEREGRLSDLLDSTESIREALELFPPGGPERATCLNNFANALSTRYHLDGNLSHLLEATQRHREGLELRPPGHPERAQSLIGLSDALWIRYERKGRLSDLSEATKYYREALELCPPGHPDRSLCLHNFSHALLAVYGREGSLSDLSEATEHYREALELRPPGHPYRASSLNSLSNALITRYDREGSMSDLSEAVEHYREALELCPPGHLDRGITLNNLSGALLTRCERGGSLLDLSDAVEHCREALGLRPPGHSDRVSTLGSLSNTLLTRYEHEGTSSDLLEAIELRREALELCPPGHRERTPTLASLANVLLCRYEHEGKRSDLLAATGYYREALELQPHGHPDRTQSLFSLSRALLHSIYESRDADNMQTLVLEVFEVLREAVGLPSCPPRQRLHAALQWIEAARTLAPDSMLDAHRAALDQLDIVLATSNTLENKHNQLTGASDEVVQTRCRRLGVEAASCAVRQGDMALAVELLERGRNLLFGQVGKYRVELEELRKVHPGLTDRFSELSELLDLSVVYNPSVLEGRTAFEDPTERYRRVSSDWAQTVDDIHAVNGFGGFLRLPNYETLRSAAAEGPVIIVLPGDDNSVALIVSQERATPYRVNLSGAGTDKLVKLCNLLAEAVNSDNSLVEERSTKTILRSLWKLVVCPIAEALENEFHIPLHSRIWWCPTSFFSLLPLHAAGDYTSEDTTQNLPDRYVSSYTPTLYALLRARSNLNRVASRGDKMLIIAQPDTPEQNLLPNAQPEAEIVERLAAEANMDSMLYSSKDGTRTAVLDSMVDHSWLHFTCHGSQDPVNPFQSCFYLYDGNLTLHDIMRHGLPDAKFAFLAACHTATGDRELVDEGLHLAAGLQFSGFRSVVGTIWEMADVDGPMIAEAFYKALQLEGPGAGGMDCSKAAYALSKAVKHLRENDVPINRWMRFIHIGI